MTVTKRKQMTVIDGGLSAQPPGGGETPDEWRRKLTFNRDGNVEGTLHNLIQIVEHDERLAGLWWLNESSNQIELTRDGPWPGGNKSEFVDADAFELAAWLQHPDRYAMKCSDDLVLKASIAVARRYRRHPIREYLSALKWDGVPRVERMFVDLFGATDTPYNLGAAKCFMVSAAARMLWFDPKAPAVGAQVDFMLVLEGEQGKRKSSALRTLFGSQWFVDTMESPSKPDFYQVIQGAWGVEIAEMDAFSRGEVTNVKGAISRRVDKFRAPYERVPRSYRRECVFVGTTNEHQYLRDPTGGRRFLPVRTEAEVDIDALVACRDQLWAEAVAIFEAGFEWWSLPPDAAAQQSERYQGDAWGDRINRWLDMLLPEDKYPSRLKFGTRVDWVTLEELLVYAIGVEPAKHTPADQRRVASHLKIEKWESFQQRWPDGGRDRRWFRSKAAMLEWLERTRATRGREVADAPDF